MKLKFRIYLRTENFESSTLVDLLNYKNSIIDITKYGYTEPLKYKVEKDQLEKAIDMFDEYLDIIFKGKNKFWLSISTTTTGLTMLGGGIYLKKATPQKIKELIEFIELFSKNNQMLYAYMSSEDEYDEKHKEIEGSGVSWKGVSQWDFFDFLPGVHWYTYFGKELIKCIEKDSLTNIKEVIYTSPGDDAIAFHLNTSISNQDDRISKLELIEKHIGESYFFSKNRKEYKHPESYITFLKSFEKGY